MSSPPLLAGDTAADAWFQFVSPVYDTLAGPLVWPRSLQSAAADRLGVDEGDRVLDVGCGTGATTTELRERTSRVDAVDLNREQLDRARRRAGLEDVRFVRADAGSLPYPDGTFDAVASVGAVLYWPDPDATLAEIHRVTRPGGRLLLAGFSQRPAAVHPASIAASAWFEAAFTTYDRSEATAMCRAAGYHEIEHRVTGPFWHPRLVLETVATKRK